MNLKLTNPLHRPLDASLGWRLARFALTAVAIFFLGIHTRILKRLTRRYTALDDPHGLPKWPRRVAACLCAGGTYFLFLSVGYLFFDPSVAIFTAFFSGLCYLLTILWLRRIGWGDRGQLPLAQVFTRLMEVIHHGLR